MTVLMVALGAVVGAPARYLTDRTLRRWHDMPFPLGTLVVNVVASFVLGIVVAASGRLDASTEALIGTGFCGALSTYSTFGYETHQLVVQRLRWTAALNLVLSLVAGLAAAALGWWIGQR